MSLQNLKLLMKDDRVAAIHAVVRAPKSGENHYSLIAGQLMIHVVAKTSKTPIWAHMDGGGRLGRGVWSIPDIGTEVVVAFDDGEFEGDAFIVGTHGRLQGVLNTGVTLLVDDSVEIRSVSGTAHALPTKADFDGIISIMNSAGTGSATALPAAVASYQSAHPTWPVCTTVLKAQ